MLVIRFCRTQSEAAMTVTGLSTPCGCPFMTYEVFISAVYQTLARMGISYIPDVSANLPARLGHDEKYHTSIKFIFSSSNKVITTM